MVRKIVLYALTFFFLIGVQGLFAEEEDYFKNQMDVLDNVLKSNPNDAQAYYQRGDVYLNYGYLDQAILDYIKALELDPDMIVAYINRALAYERKGDIEQAILDYSKVIEKNPLIINAYEGRAALYIKQGELDKSQQDIKRIKEIEASEEYKIQMQKTKRDIQEALGL